MTDRDRAEEARRIGEPVSFDRMTSVFRGRRKLFGIAWDAFRAAVFGVELHLVWKPAVIQFEAVPATEPGDAGEVAK